MSRTNEASEQHLLARNGCLGKGKASGHVDYGAAWLIKGTKYVPKRKNHLLPLGYGKRQSNVFEDEMDHIADVVVSREKAFRPVRVDKKFVRFHLPLVPTVADEPVCSVVRKHTDQTDTIMCCLKTADHAKQWRLCKGVVVKLNRLALAERGSMEDVFDN